VIVRKTIEINGKTLILETGKMAKQANGAVLVTYGDTSVLVTAVAAEEPNENVDFFPLTVEYREKFYSTGRIPGGFIKREGRPSEKEILSARLIDRPIRPLFPDDFQNETQIIANVLSMDREHDADVLAGLGSSAALGLSDIPFDGIIATVRIARVNGELIVYPTLSQVEQSDIELVVAGSEESIMMVEGQANQVAEADLLNVINTAHDSIKKLCALQKELFEGIAEQKREVIAKEVPEGLNEKVASIVTDGILQGIRIQEKKSRRKAIKETVSKAIEELQEEFPESEKMIKNICGKIEKETS